MHSQSFALAWLLKKAGVWSALNDNYDLLSVVDSRMLRSITCCSLLKEVFSMLSERYCLSTDEFMSPRSNTSFLLLIMLL